MKLNKGILQKLTNIAEQNKLLECDGLTRVVSYILSSESVDHQTMSGSLCKLATKEIVEPHFWVEVDGHILDFRARIWLGNSEAIPYGLFNEKDYEVAYIGSNVDMAISDSLFSVLMTLDN